MATATPKFRVTSFAYFDAAAIEDWLNGLNDAQLVSITWAPVKNGVSHGLWVVVAKER